MKKIIKIFSLVLVLILVKNVYAANYEMKELIPINIETSIHTNELSYKEFGYKNNSIVFKNIKNISDENKKISITIALFNSNKKNIGTINYCEGELKSKEEKSLTISNISSYLAKEYKPNDVKYISVLSDNSKCRTTGSDEFIGQTVEEIGMSKNNTMDSKSQLLIQILSIVGGALLLLFLYKFLFTRSYQNMDGSDVRKGYENYNEALKNERERELRINPPQPKEIKQTKTDEVLREEQEAQTEDKSGTDLHNLYK